MDKKILLAAVGVLAVIVVAGAVFLMNDDGADDTPETQVTGDLVLFGNANNDNFLDQKDIDFLRDIVDEKTGWDSQKYPYADADTDGDVDEDDIALVQKILDGEKCVVHYLNWNLDVMDIHYPVSGDIAVNYEVGLNAAIIGGWYDQITSMFITKNQIDGLDQKLYPDSRNMKCIRGESGVYEYDVVLSCDVNLISGDPYCYDRTILSQLAKHNQKVEQSGKGSFIDPLLMPYSREINGITWVNTIYLLGVLTGHQGENEGYVEYVTALEKKIDEEIRQNPNIETKTYVTLYAGHTGFEPSMREFNMDVYKEGAENFGDVTNCQMLPLVSAMTNPPDTFITVSIDEIIALDPDVIIISHTDNDRSDEQLKENFRLYSSYFTATKAYKENQIYWCGFDVIGATAGPSVVPYLASMIWPGEVDRQASLDLIQDYFEKFTYADFELSKSRYVPMSMADL